MDKRPSLKERLYAAFFNESWMIGLIDQPITNAPLWRQCPPIKWIGARENHRYLADPFPWPERNDLILCEQFDYAQQIGTLRRLKIKNDVIVDDNPEIIPVSGHLSFPFMFNLDGNTYMLPESCSAKELALLLWNDEAGKWQKIATPLSNTAAADSILFHHNDLYWIAYTDVDIGAMDNLNLIYSSSLSGPWRPHPANPVIHDPSRARCAGPLFNLAGQYYRPAQDCSKHYGGAIRIMRLIDCSPTSFREEEVTVLSPPRGINPHGLHTLTAWGTRCLVDGKRMIFVPHIAARKLLRRLLRLFGR